MSSSDQVTTDTASIAEATVGFDKWGFLLLYVKYGLAFTMVGIASFIILHFGMGWKPSRLKSFIARAICKDETNFRRCSTLVAILMAIIYFFVPAAFLVIWGVIAAVELKPALVGVSTALLGLAAVITVFGFMTWRAHAWRITAPTWVSYILSACCLVGFNILIIMIARPFTYIGFSSVFLSLNCIPVVMILYRHSPTVNVNFEDYVNKKVVVKLKEISDGLNDSEGEEEAEDAKIKAAKRKQAKSSSEREDEDEEEEEEQEDLYSEQQESNMSSLSTVVSFSSSRSRRSTRRERQHARRVMRMLSMSTQEEQESSLTEGAVIVDTTQTNKQKWLGTLGLWGLDVASLVAYSLLTYFFVPGSTAKYIGFVTWGAIFFIDLAVALYWWGGYFKHPLLASLVLLGARIMLIFFTDKYWFISHCAVFLILALYLGVSWVDQHYPAKSTGNDQKNLAREILDNLPSGLRLDFELPEIRESELSDEGGGGDEDEEEDEEQESIDEQQETDEGYSEGAEVEVNVREKGKKKKTGKKDEGAKRGCCTCCKKPRCVNPFLTRPGILFYLFLILLGETLAVGYIQNATEDFNPGGSVNRPQWLYGIAALIIAFTLPLSLLTWRLWAGNEYKANWKVMLSVFCTESFMVGVGVFFYEVASSIIALAIFVFCPLIIICVVVFVAQWQKNDFYFLSTKAQREEAERTCCKLLPRDWVMILGASFTIVLILGFALVMALTSSRQYIGWTIAFAIFLPILTYIMVKDFFNTFSATVTNIAALAMQIILLTIYGVLMFLLYINAVDYRAGALLFFLIMYPTLVLLGMGLFRWRDDNWQLKARTSGGKFTIFAILLSFAIFVLFGVGVLLLHSMWWGIAILVAVCFFFYALILTMIWVSNKFYLPKPWKATLVIVLLLIIGGAIALGFFSSGFLGFSVAWAVLGFATLMYAVQQELDGRKHPRQYGKVVFPVYRFHVEHQTVTVQNSGTYSVYAVFVEMMVWGVLASMWLTPPWIGLVVSMFGLALMVMVTLHYLEVPSTRFGKMLAYIDDELIELARSQARGHQFDAGEQDDSSKKKKGKKGKRDREHNENSTSDLLRMDANVPTSSELIKAQRDFVKSDDFGDQASYLRLLDPFDDEVSDFAINRRYMEEQRFVAHLQSLVLLLADGRRQKEEVILGDMLRNDEYYADLQARDIGTWGKNSDEWSILGEHLGQYLLELRKKQLRDNKNRRDDEEAAKRREEEIRKRLEAQRKKQGKKGKEKQPVAKGKVKGGGDLIKDATTADIVGDDPQKVMKGVKGHWEDDDFAAGGDLLTPDTADADWMRAGELTTFKKPTLYNKIEPTSIAQGQLGDCWLISSIAVVANDYPDKIRDLFVIDKVNDKGVYCVKFWQNGQWVRVCVDDSFPSKNGKPLYASSAPNELWVMLIEKAYAKMFTSYAAIEGGFVHIGMAALTGGAGESINMRDPAIQPEVLSGALFGKVLTYQTAGYCLGCGSNPGKDTNQSDKGIVQGHAYAILKVAEVDGNQLLRLRNPWGSGEWKGDWSDNSTKWTRRLRQKLEFPEGAAKDDGSFFMSWADFQHEFTNIYVCRIFPDTWKKVAARGEWKGKNAGGPREGATYGNNPQYAIKASRPTQAFVTLTRDAHNTEVDYGGIFVYRSDSNTRMAKHSNPEMIGKAHSNVKEVSVEVKLDPGYYIVICWARVAGASSEFTLSVHSDSAVTMEAL